MWKLLAKTVGDRELRKLTLIFAASASIQGITLALMIPFLREFLEGGPNTLTWLWIVVGAGIVAMVVETYGMIRSYRISVYDVCDRLIIRIADRALQLPLGWFTAARQAQVASAVSREINTLSHIASIVIPAIVKQMVTPAVVVVILLFVDWRLALVMIATIPFLVLAWRYMRRANVVAQVQETEAAKVAAGRLIEFARLQPILRANGAIEHGWEPLDQALSDEDVATRHALAVKSRPATLYSTILEVSFALVIAVGMSFVMNMSLDFISYIAIAVISVRVLQPLTQSVLFGTEFHASEVALKSIDEIVCAEPLPEPIPGHGTTELPNTDVRFDNVTFGYLEGQPVIKDITFEAREGSMTAFVGPSGCGKSTLLRLVARFWDVDSGAVTIGGVDVRNIPSKTLMENISMVFQDVYLFDTTIRENVRLARPDATDEELEDAARAARLDQVLDSLPDGWDTQVGQGGLKLSGGERQRVSIARAFVKDAPILLLDEITSALDGENEAAITEVMKDLAQGRTVFVVAHRLSTIRDADQVVVLEPGLNGAPSRIAEVGTPEELTLAGGLFTDFVKASSSAGRWEIKTV